ncbi:MAG: HNH endonuclease [Clostridiales bacterium]|nr:HNH endonuclease [Clostridiales bacterium]
MKEYAKRFYKSKAWQKCRAGYAKSVGGLCERCLSRGLIVPGDIVHHKCYLSAENIDDPNISLNWDNLEYLCISCHNAIHIGGKSKKRYRIDVDGKVNISDENH